MYTTSRYASLQTRDAARRMAAKAGERYLGRGKKTVRELVELARRKGYEAICIIGEKGKRPSTATWLDVLEQGGWRWKERKELE